MENQPKNVKKPKDLQEVTSKVIPNSDLCLFTFTNRPVGCHILISAYLGKSMSIMLVATGNVNLI